MPKVNSKMHIVTLLLTHIDYYRYAHLSAFFCNFFIDVRVR